MSSKNDDDIDIYADLSNFNLEETIEKLETENKELNQQVHELTSKVEQLEARNKELMKLNKNLSANISVLYKTAKLEVDRKTNAIQELTKERDDIFFRRFKFSRPTDRLQSANSNRVAPVSNAESTPASRQEDGALKDSYGRSTKQDGRRDLELRETSSHLMQKNSQEEEPAVREGRSIVREKGRCGAEPFNPGSRVGSSNQKEKERQHEESSSLDSRERRSGEKSGREGEAVTVESRGGSCKLKNQNGREEETLIFEMRARNLSNLKVKSRHENSAVELGEESSNPKEKNREEDESSTSKQREKPSKEKEMVDSKRQVLSNSKEKSGEGKMHSTSKSRAEKSSDSKRKSQRQEEPLKSKLKEELGKEKISEKKERSQREVEPSTSELRKEKSKEKEQNLREKEPLTSERKEDELEKKRDTAKKERSCRVVEPCTSKRTEDELAKDNFAEKRERSRRVIDPSTSESSKEKSSVRENEKRHREKEFLTSELKIKNSYNGKEESNKKTEHFTSEQREKRRKEEESSTSKLRQDKTSISKMKSRRNESREENSSNLEAENRREKGPSASESRGEKSSSVIEKSNRDDASASESKRDRLPSSKEKANCKEEPSSLVTRRSSRQAAKSLKNNGINAKEQSVSERQTTHIQRASKLSLNNEKEMGNGKESWSKSFLSKFELDLSGRESNTDLLRLNLGKSENPLGALDKNRSSRLSLRFKCSENTAKEHVPVTLSTTGIKHVDLQNGNPKDAPQTTISDYLEKEANPTEILPARPDVKLKENIPFSQTLQEIRGEEALMEPPEPTQEIQSQSENPTPETSRDAYCGEESLSTSASPQKKGRRKSGNSRVYVKTRCSPRLSAKLQIAAKQTTTDIETTTEVSTDVSLLQVLQLEEIRRTSSSPRIPCKLATVHYNEAPSSPLPTLVSDLQGVFDFPSFSSLTNNISDRTAENLHRCLVASAQGESAPVVADLTPVSPTCQFPPNPQTHPSYSAVRSASSADREDAPSENVPMSSPGNTLNVRSPNYVNAKESSDEIPEKRADAGNDFPAVPLAGILSREETSVTTDLARACSSILKNTMDDPRAAVPLTTVTGSPLVLTDKPKTPCQEYIGNLLTASEDPCSPPTTPTGRDKRSQVSRFSTVATAGSTAPPPTTSSDKLTQKDNSNLLAILGDSPATHSPRTTPRKEAHQREASRSLTSPVGPAVSSGTMVAEEKLQEDVSQLLAILGDSPATAHTNEIRSTEVASSSAVVRHHRTCSAAPGNEKEALGSSSSIEKITSFGKVASSGTCNSFKVPLAKRGRNEVQCEVFNTAATQEDCTAASSAALGKDGCSRREESSTTGSGSEVAGIPSSLSKDSEEVSRDDISSLPAREESPSTGSPLAMDRKEASRKRSLSVTALAKDPLLQPPEIQSGESVLLENVPNLPNNLNDQPALKCINSEINCAGSGIIPNKNQVMNTADKPGSNSQSLQWDFKVRRRTKVELKIVMKSPPPVASSTVNLKVNKTVNEVNHRLRSRSPLREPPRSHTRENLPPGRPDHGHSRGHHPRSRGSPPHYTSRSPPYRRSPVHRHSRKDGRRSHGFDFSRRSRSCSPFDRTRLTRDHRVPRPDKLPADKKARELYLFGKSPAQDSSSPSHNPCQQPQDRLQPQRSLVMTVNRRRKNVKLEDSLEDKKIASPAPAKPASLSSSSRLVQTPLDFRERYAEVFSNTGESSDSEADGLAFSDSESSKSVDSDISYRPKGRKRKKTHVSKARAETKRPRTDTRR